MRIILFIRFFLIGNWRVAKNTLQSKDLVDPKDFFRWR
jgi:hypothetical protein